jgi:sortase A
MNLMEPSDGARSAVPSDASDTPPERQLSRRSMITIGVPAVIAVVAVGAVPFVIGAGDERVRTSGIDASATTDPPSTTPPDDVFTSSGVAVEETPILPGSTTSTTTTTATTTTTTTLAPTTLAPTTLAPTTLPAQPSQPIAPPPDPRGYEDQIQLGGISIPKLGVDAPLLEGIRLTTLDNGPGHWPGTAMPGEIGNVVVAAHRTSHGGPFRNIDQLVAGDTVMFTTEAGDLPYRVTGTQVVNPDAIWIVDPTDTPTATLFACHPPGSVAQRIVVKLELAA